MHRRLSANIKSIWAPSELDVGTGVDLDKPNSNGNPTGHHLSTPQMHVKLCIYDILGREITTLVNEYQKPGYYEINWNASNLPSGIYIYRFQVGDPGKVGLVLRRAQQTKIMLRARR